MGRCRFRRATSGSAIQSKRPAFANTIARRERGGPASRAREVRRAHSGATSTTVAAEIAGEDDRLVSLIIEGGGQSRGEGERDACRRNPHQTADQQPAPVA